MLGSFLNVVISRVPIFAAIQHRPVGTKAPIFDLVTPARSICPKCEQVIPWRHNIPVLAWMFLRGRAACCDAPIRVRYLIVECLGLATALLAWSIYGATWAAVFFAGFCLTTISIAVVDIETQKIPHALTIPLGACGLIFASLGVEYGASTDVESAVYGMLWGGFGIWAVRYIHLRLTHRRGLGGGDIYLTAAIGAWLGWWVLPFALAFAFGAAVLYALWLIINHGANRDISLPLGPFLAAGGTAAYLLC